MASGWRPTRRAAVERRGRPRIPIAVPIRYATEQGHVGVGVLIDIHEQGAGLLVPDLTPDVLHVWVQFLWFDDEMGLQGRVAFVRDTPDGFHVGLELYHYNPRSLAFLTDLVIPYGMRKFRLERRGGSLRHAPASRGREWRGGRRRRYLPMHVEQGTLRVWAITEDRAAHGAVLLLPGQVRRDEPVTLTTWGRPGAHIAHVVDAETLRVPPVEMQRVVVTFTRVPFARAEGGRVVP
jgi:hypothetical protein